jgi:hypothetical protein
MALNQGMISDRSEMPDLPRIAAECRERAARLRRDAAAVTYGPARESILHLANTWDRLADEANRDCSLTDRTLPPAKHPPKRFHDA